jgi:hypothetical protein
LAQESRQLPLRAISGSQNTAWKTTNNFGNYVNNSLFITLQATLNEQRRGARNSIHGKQSIEVT